MNGKKRLLTDLFFIICSALFFAGWTMTEGATRILCLLIYLAVVLIAIGVLLFGRHGKKQNPVEAEISRNLTLKFLTQVYMPVVICDETGRIVWSNDAARGLFVKPEPLRDKFLDHLVTVKLEEVLETTEPEGIEAKISHDAAPDYVDTVFRIRSYPLTAGSSTYSIMFWNNKSEVYEAKKRMEDESTAVAYIMIDNLDELQQYVKDEYRYVAAKVDEILKDWAQSIHGILKEYEKDRYLLLFENKYTEQMMAGRFPVLDAVRQIRAGGSNIPVTVSMGVAHFDASMPEKELAAKAALDTALQRGGDQAVLRDGTETFYFGGKTKSMQKRTKVRSRVVALELCELISRASNVIVMGHANADHDSIASCVGVARLAMSRGIPVKICIRPVNSNVKICLDALDADKEESAFSDVFTEPSAAIDFVSSETLLIICDVNNERTFEAPELYENVKNTVVIDHHRKTSEFRYEPLISYIDPSASSSSELLAEILEQVLPTGALPQSEANLLLSGIQLDTNDFTRNAGVRTFAVAQYLRSEGGNPSESKQLFRMSLEDYLREASFETNVSLYREKIAIAQHRAVGDSIQDRIAAAKVADKLLGVTGVSAAFTLVEIDRVVYISARSSGNINVQLILESLNGGGHYDVAGAQLSDVTMEMAIAQLKASIDAFLDK